MGPDFQGRNSVRAKSESRSFIIVPNAQSMQSVKSITSLSDEAHQDDRKGIRNFGDIEPFFSEGGNGYAGLVGISTACPVSDLSGWVREERGRSRRE